MKKILVIFSLLFPFTTKAAGLVPCGGEGEPLCNICYIFVLIDNIFDFFSLKIVPPISIILLIVAGFMMVVSLGGQKWILFARRLIKSVIIGTLVFYGAWMVINFSFAFFGFSEWQGITKGGFKIECSVPDRYYVPPVQVDYPNNSEDKSGEKTPPIVYINPDTPEEEICNESEQLTEHFNLSEFATPSAKSVCQSFCKNDSDISGEARLNNFRNVAKLLEKIRERVNEVYSKENGKEYTVYLGAGWRCRENNNTTAGHAENSYHIFGMAADIKVPGLSTDQLLEIVNRLNPNGGVGRYDTFVHVDIRGERARWDLRSSVTSLEKQIIKVKSDITMVQYNGMYSDMGRLYTEKANLENRLKELKSWMYK